MPGNMAPCHGALPLAGRGPRAAALAPLRCATEGGGITELNQWGMGPLAGHKAWTPRHGFRGKQTGLWAAPAHSAVPAAHQVRITR